MRTLLGIFFASNALSFACGHFSRSTVVNSSSDIITSPSYPESYGEYEECEWVITSSMGKDHMVVINVTKIRLVYWASGGGYFCSGQLAIAGNRVNCYSRAPFCNVYHNSTYCQNTATSSTYSNCARKNLPAANFSVNFESTRYDNIRSPEQIFKLRYDVISCAGREQGGNSTEAVTQHGEMNVAAIAAPVCFILFLVLAILFAWWYFYRKRQESLDSYTQQHYVNSNNLSYSICADKSMGSSYGTSTEVSGRTRAETNRAYVDMEPIPSKSKVVKPKNVGIYGMTGRTSHNAVANNYVNIGIENTRNTMLRNMRKALRPIPVDIKGTYTIADGNYTLAEEPTVNPKDQIIDEPKIYTMANSSNEIEENAAEEGAYERVDGDGSIADAKYQMADGKSEVTLQSPYQMADKDYELIDGKYTMAKYVPDSECQPEDTTYEAVFQPYAMAEEFELKEEQDHQYSTVQTGKIAKRRKHM